MYQRKEYSVCNLSFVLTCIESEWRKRCLQRRLLLPMTRLHLKLSIRTREEFEVCNLWNVYVTLNNRSLEAKTFLIIPRNHGEKQRLQPIRDVRARRHRGTQSPPCLHFPFDSRVCHPRGPRTRIFDVEKCKLRPRQGA